jgi:hypothetical protein
MDIDFLIKAMKVLLSVLTLISILFKTISIWLNLGWHQTRIKKDRIESLEPILNGGVDWYKRENRLLIEEAFQYAYRKPISFEEIRILILTDNPKEAITNYLRYRPNLKVSEDKRYIEYKKYPKRRISLFDKSFDFPVRLVTSLLLYFAFAIPGMAALEYIIYNKDTAGLNEMLLAAVAAGSFWLAAIVFLIEGLKYNSSIKPLEKSLGHRIKMPDKA